MGFELTDLVVVSVIGVVAFLVKGQSMIGAERHGRDADGAFNNTSRGLLFGSIVQGD